MKKNQNIYIYNISNAIPSVGTGPRTTESAVVKFGFEKKKMEDGKINRKKNAQKGRMLLMLVVRLYY